MAIKAEIIEKKIQQGDVILYKLKENALPDVNFTKESKDRVILALGETTGHEHNIKSSDVLVADINLESITPESAREFLSAKALKVMVPTKLRHGKPGDYDATTVEGTRLSHEALELEPGLYVVRHKREYDFFKEEASRVID